MSRVGRHRGASTPVASNARRFALSVAAAALLTASAAGAAPYRPPTATTVIATLPAHSGPHWDAVRALRAELATNPDAAEAAARLAGHYLELFRTEGDPRLVGYAQAALERWSTTADPPREIAIQLIAVAQMQHRFDEALARLAPLLVREPRYPDAWLLKAAIAQVRGDYTDSRQACARLILLADALTGGVCLAGVQAVTGRAHDADAFFATALTQLESGANSRAVVWVATLAAENAAALGSAAEADARFRLALAATRQANEQPTIYLLSGYADFLLAEHRPADALALLATAPLNDSTLLRIAAAKKRLGMPMAAELSDLDYRLQLTLAGQSPTHGREAAYFLLRVRNEPRRALANAVQNFGAQREPLDALLLLEAAVAVCEPATAEPVLDWLRVNKIENAALHTLSERLRRPGCA